MQAFGKKTKHFNLFNVFVKCSFKVSLLVTNRVTIYQFNRSSGPGVSVALTWNILKYRTLISIGLSYNLKGSLVISQVFFYVITVSYHQHISKTKEITLYVVIKKMYISI